MDKNDHHFDVEESNEEIGSKVGEISDVGD